MSSVSEARKLANHKYYVRNRAKILKSGQSIRDDIKSNKPPDDRTLSERRKDTARKYYLKNKSKIIETNQAKREIAVSTPSDNPYEKAVVFQLFNQSFSDPTMKRIFTFSSKNEPSMKMMINYMKTNKSKKYKEMNDYIAVNGGWQNYDYKIVPSRPVSSKIELLNETNRIANL